MSFVGFFKPGMVYGKVYGIINSVELSRKMSLIYENKDWHSLSDNEKTVVEMLQDAGYLGKNKPDTGYVGEAL